MTSKSTIYRKAKWPLLCKKNKDGKVIEFTIEEDRWAHVDNNDNTPNGCSFLLNKKGAMYCLGFYTRACGVSPVHTYNSGSPACISYALSPHKMPLEMVWLVNSKHMSSKKAIHLMDLNDNMINTSLTINQRKKNKYKRFLNNKELRLNLLSCCMKLSEYFPVRNCIAI